VGFKIIFHFLFPLKNQLILRNITNLILHLPLQFIICTADKSKIRFRAEDMSINQSLLDLCVGTHNLYLRRRQPDLLEVQQMRLQAQEHRHRRLAEQMRLQREREQRALVERERDRLRAELGHLVEQMTTMQARAVHSKLKGKCPCLSECSQECRRNATFGHRASAHLGEGSP
jgi:hypothetical protein